MNGRLYDPALGRFLGPDILNQDPTNSQSYNRYSYCLNNPLKYTDPSGWSSEANDEDDDFACSPIHAVSQRNQYSFDYQANDRQFDYDMSKATSDGEKLMKKGLGQENNILSHGGNDPTYGSNPFVCFLGPKGSKPENSSRSQSTQRKEFEAPTKVY